MSNLFRITSFLFLAAAVCVSMGSQVVAEEKGRFGGGTEENEAAQTGELLSEQLSDRLERALDRHPDVAAARAKLALAEAELERVRMEISQEVIRLHLELNAHKLRLKRIIELAKNNAVPQQELIEAKAKLDDLNVQLELLLGRFDANRRGGRHEAKRGGFGIGKRTEEIEIEEEEDVVKKAKQIPNEKLRKTLARALYEETRMQFAATPLPEAVHFLSDQHDFNVSFDNIGLEESGIDVENVEVNTIVSGITLKAALMMLEDQNEDIRFVVADYGMVLTAKGSNLDVKYVSVENADDWIEGGYFENVFPGKTNPSLGFRRQLVRSLNEVVDEEEFSDISLVGFGAWLSKTYGLNVVVDKLDLESGKVDAYEKSISLVVKKIDLRSLLELIEDQKGIQFLAGDEVIVIAGRSSRLSKKYVGVITYDRWRRGLLPVDSSGETAMPTGKKRPPEKVRARLAAALERPVKYEFADNTTLRRVVDNLMSQCELPVFYDVGQYSRGIDTYVPSLTVKDLTLKSALELLSDVSGDHYLAVTDFGIFVTSPNSPMAQKYHSISTVDEWIDRGFRTKNGGEKTPTNVEVSSEKTPGKPREAN